MEKHEMMAFPYKRPCEWMSHAMSTIAETKHSTLYGWFMIEKRSFPVKRCHLYISFQRFVFLPSRFHRRTGKKMLEKSQPFGRSTKNQLGQQPGNQESRRAMDSPERWDCPRPIVIQKWRVNITPFTLPETHSLHLKMGFPKRKRIFQPSIFRCYVSFREGIGLITSPQLGPNFLGHFF